jgi:hypothetical protein
MHTQFQFVPQVGAVIAAIAKLEKRNKGTNVAVAENVIWCPGALRVVIPDGTEEGTPRDRTINYLGPFKETIFISGEQKYTNIDGGTSSSYCG